MCGLRAASACLDPGSRRWGRCAQCPDRDDRDPISVIHTVVARLDPAVDRDLVASAVSRLASRPAHQRKVAWA
ncbi:hypothetical protein [Mycolicibacterium aubagnense]|nr:hypothetical protein [Mycolicibacterium aubagnense]